MIGIIITLFLTILKIIGIILLIVIGIILLAVLIVLFVPFCYDIKAYFDEEIRIYLKYSWLFHIINGKFIKEGEEQELTLKVFVFNMLKKEEKTEIKKEIKVVTEPEEVKVKEEVKETEFEPEIQTQSKIKKAIKEEPIKKEKKVKIKKKKVKTKKDKSVKNKLKEFWEFLQEPENEGVLIFIFIKLKKMIISILPKKINIDMEVGLNDPANTGMVTGIASMLYGYTSGNIHIMPNFDEEIIKGQVFVKGKIYVYPIVFTVIRIIINKKVRSLIKKVRSL